MFNAKSLLELETLPVSIGKFLPMEVLLHIARCSSLIPDAAGATAEGLREAH